MRLGMPRRPDAWVRARRLAQIPAHRKTCSLKQGDHAHDKRDCQIRNVADAEQPLWAGRENIAKESDGKDGQNQSQPRGAVASPCADQADKPQREQIDTHQKDSFMIHLHPRLSGLSVYSGSPCTIKCSAQGATRKMFVVPGWLKGIPAVTRI